MPVYASNASSGCIGVTHGATHYGRFWKILSQNWGMNFCSCGFIFILFLKILTSKAQNAADHVPSVEIFEIETKFHLQGLNFKLEFWDENLQNWP